MVGRLGTNGFNANGQKYRNGAPASDPTDMPTWAQVQALIAGLQWRPSTRVGTATNVNLASPGANVDGKAMAANDDFLVFGQTDATQNGVYTWNGASAAATRRADYAAGGIQDNNTCFIREGTYADKAFTITNDAAITIGTTSIGFAQVGGGQSYTADETSLHLTGTVFNVINPFKKYAINVGDGSSTSIVVTHNLNTLDVIAILYLNSTGEEVDFDITSRTVNSITIGFATAPASGLYRAVVQ